MRRVPCTLHREACLFKVGSDMLENVLMEGGRGGGLVGRGKLSGIK